jgi:hypothetical protein
MYRPITHLCLCCAKPEIWHVSTYHICVCAVPSRKFDTCQPITDLCLCCVKLETWHMSYYAREFVLSSWKIDTCHHSLVFVLCQAGNLTRVMLSHTCLCCEKLEIWHVSSNHALVFVLCQAGKLTRVITHLCLCCVKLEIWHVSCYHALVFVLCQGKDRSLHTFNKFKRFLMWRKGNGRQNKRKKSNEQNKRRKSNEYGKGRGEIGVKVDAKREVRASAVHSEILSWFFSVQPEECECVTAILFHFIILQ